MKDRQLQSSPMRAGKKARFEPVWLVKRSVPSIIAGTVLFAAALMAGLIVLLERGQARIGLIASGFLLFFLYISLSLLTRKIVYVVEPESQELQTWEFILGKKKLLTRKSFYEIENITVRKVSVKHLGYGRRPRWWSVYPVRLRFTSGIWETIGSYYSQEKAKQVAQRVATVTRRPLEQTIVDLDPWW